MYLLLTLLFSNTCWRYHCLRLQTLLSEYQPWRSLEYSCFWVTWWIRTSVAAVLLGKPALSQYTWVQLWEHLSAQRSQARVPVIAAVICNLLGITNAPSRVEYRRCWHHNGLGRRHRRCCIRCLAGPPLAMYSFSRIWNGFCSGLTQSKTVLIPLWVVQNPGSLQQLVRELRPAWSKSLIKNSANDLGLFLGPGAGHSSWDYALRKHDDRVR